MKRRRAQERDEADAKAQAAARRDTLLSKLRARAAAGGAPAAPAAPEAPAVPEAAAAPTQGSAAEESDDETTEPEAG